MSNNGKQSPSSALPNLAGVATQDLVEKIQGGTFSPSYINWSRTMNMLREHAPGWLPYTHPNPEAGGLVHYAPAFEGGGYLLIGFRHMDGRETPLAPQAIMDNRNNPIPRQRIDARDITDAQRRGICMAAALFFGLAYELWAKMPLESGYAETQELSAGNNGRASDPVGAAPNKKGGAW